MKELTAKEAIKYPIGTKFKVNRVGTVEIANVYCTKCFRVLNLETPKIIGDDNVPILNDVWLNAKYVKIQEPVSFMAVVNSGRRCKVEYPNAPEGYMELGEMLYYLGNDHNSELCAEIIKEGKWYVEE